MVAYSVVGRSLVLVVVAIMSRIVGIIVCMCFQGLSGVGGVVSVLKG